MKLYYLSVISFEHSEDHLEQNIIKNGRYNEKLYHSGQN